MFNLAQDFELIAIVKMICRFVKNDDFGLLNQRTGNHNLLTLATA